MVDFLGSTTVIPGSPASSSVYSRWMARRCAIWLSTTRICPRPIPADTLLSLIVSDLFVLVPGERFTCLGSIELHSLGFLFRMA